MLQKTSYCSVSAIGSLLAFLIKSQCSTLSLLSILSLLNIDFTASQTYPYETKEISYVIEPFESINIDDDTTWFKEIDDMKLNLTIVAKDEDGDEDPLFGKGALRVEYRVQQKTEEDEEEKHFVDFGSILAMSEAPFNCKGATHLSLWYDILEINSDSSSEKMNGDVQLRLVLLDDSDCVVDCADPPGSNLENYYSLPFILNTDSTGWQELRVDLRGGDDNSDLPVLLTNWTGQKGNNQLDLDHIRGWRIELSAADDDSQSDGSEGILLIDQLACEGDGNLFGSAFKIQDNNTFQDAVKEGYWHERYYESPTSQNLSDVTLVDGTLSLNYTIEQVKTWGGYVEFQHIAPGPAYYNLSHAKAVSLEYKVQAAASPPERAHLRLILMDNSNCDVDCSLYPGSNLENYYSFHYILDIDDWSSINATHTADAGDITVRLEGSSDSSSPFWRPGWDGIVGNDILDKSMIKGYRLVINIDDQGDIDSLVQGVVELENLVSIPKVTDVDDNNITDGMLDCVVEPDLNFLISDDDETSEFKKIPFLGGSKCCEACDDEPGCLFGLYNDLDCYIASYVKPESVGLIDSDRSHTKITAFWKDDKARRGGDDFCDRCHCHEGELTIDCRGKDLVILPKTFTPDQEDEQRQTTTSPPSWSPRILDLRNNTRLVLIGTGTLSSVSDTLEELRLPKNVRYFAPESVNDLPKLTSVVFEKHDEDTASPNHNVNNVITQSDGFYGDVCCNRGTHLELLSPAEGLTFCEMESFYPGIDAVYEPFYDYLGAKELAKILPSSSFMSEAAGSPELCAEYCQINSRCKYFKYDTRLTQTEPTCHLLADNGTKSRVCCKPDDYADVNGTLPGWTSGRPPRTRHDLDNARVFVSPVNLIANKTNGYKTQFQFSLGSDPKRGAVWIETSVTSNLGNLNVSISPRRTALYNASISATVDVTISNAGSLLRDEIILLENSIQSCDVAFVSGTTNTTRESYVTIDVIAPDSSDSSNRGATIAVILVPSLVFLLLVLVLLYNGHKRRQADKVWNIKMSELQFDDPPEIIGRGTFGLVLLAEYRGTTVAVKRVIPPSSVGASELRTSFFGLGDRLGWLNNLSLHASRPPVHSMSFDDGDLESGTEQPKKKNLGVSTVRPQKKNLGVSTAGTHHFHTSEGSASVVLKKCSCMNRGDEYSRLKADFAKEMRHLSKLRHPCITTVMGAVICREEEPMLVMEYMDHGSLYDLLNNETMMIDGEHILPILRDITQGVRFLHAANPQVIHGDLKARNILVDSKFRAKVADFGLTQKQQLGAVGTPFWMAPELLRGESTNTAASDVYSMGIILYEVYARKDPYEGEDYDDVLKRVADPLVNYRPPVPPACPPAIESLMAKCLSNDADTRPTFEELDLELKAMDVDNVEPSGAPSSVHRKELQMTTSLLFDVFPRHIAESLRKGHKVEPESREIVTIFFCDIVGFTNISSTLEPIKISDMLDRLYGKFDILSRQHDVFKVETIGDAYMAVTNLVKDQNDDHVKRIAEFSIDALKAANETLIDTDNPDKGCVNIRVGFHSGPVVANVVGSRNPRYCLFGDTVNTASRMESNSIKNRIHCSERSASLLRCQCPEMSLCSRGIINVKGKGEMHTFWVNESTPTL